MKINFLNKFLDHYNIDKNINCIFYNFKNENVSGRFVKNLINLEADQYGEDAGEKYLIQDYRPGFFTNCYDKNYRSTGMAYFEGNDTLKVSKSLSSENFNLMLNMKSYGCNPDYIDVDIENLNRPSGIFLDNEFYLRTPYPDGIRFRRLTNSIIFNRNGQFGDYGDWYYSSGTSLGAVNTLITEGIASKLPKKLASIEKTISFPSEFLLGKAQSLINVRSKNNSSQPFDLKVAISNNHKLMFEFSGSHSGESIIFNKICTGELSNQNIISLNGSKDDISVCYHDFLANRNHCESINTTFNFLNQEKDIYIGNNANEYNGIYYTGYRGLLSNVLLFTGFLNQDTQLSLSKLFIKTGEHISVESTIETNYNLLSSGYLSTGYIGSGITGYELVQTEQVSACTDDCVFYIKSGLTGLLTGEIIKYQLVQSASSSYAQSGITIEDYDSGNANSFTKNYLIIYKPIDNKDFIEVQSYELFDNLRNTTYSLGGDVYTSENSLNSNKNHIFFNGIDIMSGYYQISNIKKLIIDPYKKDDKDHVSYKQFPLNTFDKIFDYSGQNHIAGTTIHSVGVNVFLNGQKLINNYNYNIIPFIDLLFNDGNISYIGEDISCSTNDTIDSTIEYLRYFIRLNNDTILTSGEMYISEDNAIKYTTGSNTGFFDLKPNYGSDMMWLNGILQRQFDDYVLLSCNNNTIQDYEQKPIKNQPIYASQAYRFNIT